VLFFRGLRHFHVRVTIRCRLLLSVIPLSPMLLMGLADMIIYRRTEGQVGNLCARVMY
jgi:hypothetical protein